MNQICVLSGKASSKLAERIEKENVDLQLTPVDIQQFADGEIWCQVKKSVRGHDVFIIQSTSTPVNDNLMELFILADACRRASAKSITAIIPYFGYARQDRKTQARVPITASLVARLIETSGINRVVCVDMHCGQIQGFFPTIPSDNLGGQITLAQSIFTDLTLKYKSDTGNKKDSVLSDHHITIVSPDAGGAERADYFRKCFKHYSGLKSNMAMMNKKRDENNMVSKMELIGKVKGTLCIIVDDMIDTAGTLCKAAEMLAEAGATSVICACSHGLFNGKAIERIHNSKLSKVYCLDTIMMSKENEEKMTKLGSNKIKYISVAKLLGQTIIRVNRGLSIGELFDV
mmetsp:Transcript_9150/g.13530  ORF Transcript_9150/g.13530 Transcript_9150/m.13530 type:complete len:345 (-) Transcript_9150:1446-2480(-)